jgi:hypothetical protein
MKQRPLQWNVFRDDGGQAITEFVIVIPILLLFFFAMLQYFANVQASQLGNYAAFVAARVYAVRASIDANDAKDKAQKAAAMVLAPIARPVPGEIGGDTAVSSIVGTSLNTLQSVLGSKFANYITGYGMAEYVRLNSSLLGGSVTITNEGSPKQVDVIINYPQPVFIPGLAGLWNFVAGDKVYYGMKSLRKGLSGVPSYVLPVYETANQAQQFSQLLAQYDPGAASSLSSLASSLPTVMLPYINIQSKCSIGYSDWGSKDPDYRPREHANTDDSDSSGTSTNQDLANTQKNMDQMNQDKTTYDNAVNDAKAKCQALCTADDNLAAAHQKDDPIINDPNASASAKSAAQVDLQNAIKAQKQAKNDNDTAQRNLNSATSSFQSDLNNLNNESSVGKQSSLPSIPCGCN